ncbi:RidA family protein [Streptomyces sioyaensis]|uniref:RidA family protein n=1 Tax=Streptomyces sioyaensis TaxID=67364 RepID=UPI001F18E382|nr:RidA family protein [Streptomyces sioyaensis]MCF3171929.1 RidA family protein [Streptomyces sioyaensis]
MGQVSRRLEELGLTLPPLLPKLANYVPAKTVGELVFVSGHGPLNPDGSVKYRGRLGADFTVADGKEAARLVTMNILSALQAELGDLDRIREFVKLLVMVQSAPDFQEQHVVAEGASDLLTEVFGPECGSHARSAVGMMSLPFGIAVEIEAVVRIAP